MRTSSVASFYVQSISPGLGHHNSFSFPPLLTPFSPFYLLFNLIEKTFIFASDLLVRCPRTIFSCFCGLVLQLSSCGLGEVEWLEFASDSKKNLDRTMGLSLSILLQSFCGRMTRTTWSSNSAYSLSQRLERTDIARKKVN